MANQNVNDQQASHQLSEQFQKQWRQFPLSVEDFLSKTSLPSQAAQKLTILLIKCEIELRRSAGEEWFAERQIRYSLCGND